MGNVGGAAYFLESEPAATTPASVSSPELDLVRLAARADLGPERSRAFRHAAEQPLDWTLAVRLAQYHRLVPLLFVHLRDHVPAAPEAVVSALHDAVRKTSVHVLFLSSEMARVARRLDRDGVPYLVFKGPSLAEAYGSVAKRPFVDNDILVHREDFGRVERALLDLGFGTQKRSDRQQSGYLWVHGEYTFRRMVGAARSAVDVHTNLVPFGFSYAPSFGELRGRARTLDVAGTGVPVLGWDDLFLTLSVNALKDQWDRLRLATDLAEVARLVDDWDAVGARAAQLGSRRAVHLAVLVAADEVGGEFPPHLVRQSRQDRRAQALARRARAFFETSAETRVRSGRGRASLNLLVQDGLRGQLRYSGFAAVRRAMERWVDPGA